MIGALRKLGRLLLPERYEPATDDHITRLRQARDLAEGARAEAAMALELARSEREVRDEPDTPSRRRESHLETR